MLFQVLGESLGTSSQGGSGVTCSTVSSGGREAGAWAWIPQRGRFRRHWGGEESTCTRDLCGSQNLQDSLVDGQGDERAQAIKDDAPVWVWIWIRALAGWVLSPLVS